MSKLLFRLEKAAGRFLRPGAFGQKMPTPWVIKSETGTHGNRDFIEQAIAVLDDKPGDIAVFRYEADGAGAETLFFKMPEGADGFVVVLLFGYEPWQHELPPLMCRIDRLAPTPSHEQWKARIDFPADDKTTERSHGLNAWSVTATKDELAEAIAWGCTEGMAGCQLRMQKRKEKGIT